VIINEGLKLNVGDRIAGDLKTPYGIFAGIVYQHHQPAVNDNPVYVWDTVTS
jgi:hypothetical protein